MNIRTLLEAGQRVQDAAHAEAEEAKRGNLRGGSAGVVADGKVYGECHRIAYARSIGLDKEHDENRAIMFAAGNANEDVWAGLLTSAGATFRREDEIPVVVELLGRKITGRPDIVLGEEDDGEFVPEFGIELKGIFSASSAVRVELEGIPDPKHLAQAAMYSMALNIPYVLSYTSASVIDVPYWAQKKFGGLKKLQPFYRHFYMRWTADDVLEYRDENESAWVTTVYTKQGILDFYTTIVEMEQAKDLGPRPQSAYATGEKMPFDRCDYCDLAAFCAQYENDHDAWVAAIRESKLKESA